LKAHVAQLRRGACNAFVARRMCEQTPMARSSGQGMHE